MSTGAADSHWEAVLFFNRHILLFLHLLLYALDQKRQAGTPPLSSHEHVQVLSVQVGAVCQQFVSE